ncbi:hypothetical protein CEP54_009996 [Fusarium duplospermum]|uniref:AIG1-type G domain-containing protein n=1 Tax=Fusarium duplospermum TaxID=1325734 RepID=A0A428PMJ0_9HYPO|nr:hypothetical protein CEP54_009996 [Fusarium duplospermum]
MLVQKAAGFDSDGSAKANGMGMIVVMGVTGSGKSYLINCIAGKEVVVEGPDMDSCTQECQMVPVVIGGSKVMLIDTPGFDDSERSEAAILNSIARVLTAQYNLGFELKGIIYMQRITDIRHSGSSAKSLEIFKRIRGEEALKNVLLVTNRWEDMDEALGASRERQLREKFWAYMLGRGSCMNRFYGDRSSAISLVSDLLIKDPVMLRIQHEIINEHKDLNETWVGSFVDGGLEKLREEHVKEIESLENLKKELKESDRVMRRRMEANWEREQARLRETEEQQVSLRRDVCQEVKSEIAEENESESGGLKELLPLIPAALGILGVFVGVPPGSLELLGDFVEVFSH